MSDIQALKDMTTSELNVLSGMFMTMAETLQKGSSVALDQVKNIGEKVEGHIYERVNKKSKSKRLEKAEMK